MINRELIRLKAVQLVYAFSKNEGNSIKTAEKEFSHSLAAAYELYKYQLTLLIQVYNYAQRREEALKARDERLGATSGEVGTKLARNKVLAQLAADKTLTDYMESEKGEWIEEPALVKNLYEQFVGSDAFAQYIDKGDDSYEADRALVRKLYKTFVCGNESLADILEAHNLYWNDDKDIIDSFVLKTLKRITEPAPPVEVPQETLEDNGDTSEEEETSESSLLLPQFASKDDEQFATELFHKSLTMREQTEALVRENCKNWEFERLAFMDVIIAEVALTEMLSFPTIPVGVTLNEYIEIARYYSTPQSPAYINGLLDGIASKLKAEGKLLKTYKA